MNGWEDFKRNFVKKYDFLTKIQAGTKNADYSGQLHPITLLSAGLALEVINSPNIDRLAIWVPNKEHLAKWLAFLLSLQITREDYRKRTTSRVQFKPGQKLLVNGAIVEYIKEEPDPTWGLMFTVRYMEGKTPVDYTFPWSESKKLHFQPVTTDRKLSQFRKATAALNALSERDVPIDSILNTRTFGNKAFLDNNCLLVSSIGETEQLLQEVSIKNEILQNITLWAKISSEGDYYPLAPYDIDANPACLVASDPFRANKYLIANPGKTKCVVIDGIRRYENDPYSIGEILNKNLKVIAVIDYSDEESISYLEEKGFMIWKWDKDKITRSRSTLFLSQDSPFFNFNRHIQSFLSNNISIEKCSSGGIEKVIEATSGICSLLRRDYQRIDALKISMINSANGITRLIRIPEEDEINNIKAMSSELYNSLQTYKQLLEGEQLNKLDDWLSVMKDFSLTSLTYEHAKPAKFKELILRYRSNMEKKKGKIAVILHNDEEAKKVQEYWSNILPTSMTEIYYFSFDEFLIAEDIGDFSKIIFSGWFGYEKMNRLLNQSKISGNLIFLFYPEELTWYERAKQRREKMYTVRTDVNELAKLLGNSVEELSFVNVATKEVDTDQTTAEEDIVDLEMIMKRRQYKKYAGTDYTTNDNVDGKLVLFTDRRFCFMTNTHKVPVVTNIIVKKALDENIEYAGVNGLKEGDYILFMESDRDLIRNIADEMLKKDEKSELRDTAKLWKVALLEEYNNLTRDLERLVRILSVYGCTKHQVTIKQWLFDKELIGPRDMNDLDAIASATRDPELKERLDEVKAAIEEIRSAHLQAGEYLARKLLLSLPKVIRNREMQGESEDTTVNIDFEGFGKIYLVQVLEIDMDWTKVGNSRVNKLLRKENT